MHHTTNFRRSNIMRKGVAMSNGTKRCMGTRQHDRTGGPYSRRSHRPTPTPSQANGFGTAKKSYERYITLARAAASNGDAIEAENLYQHAEHYFRLMTEHAV